MCASDARDKGRRMIGDIGCWSRIGRRRRRGRERETSRQLWVKATRVGMSPTKGVHRFCSEGASPVLATCLYYTSHLLAWAMTRYIDLNTKLSKSCRSPNKCTSAVSSNLSTSYLWGLHWKNPVERKDQVSKLCKLNKNRIKSTSDM